MPACILLAVANVVVDHVAVEHAAIVAPRVVPEPQVVHVAEGHAAGNAVVEAVVVVVDVLI